MGRDTGIEWADHTFNAWWGCEKVSPACRDCYAETFADRFPKTRGLWGAEAPRKIASENTWREPEKWFEDAVEAGVQRRVFCASMGDVFEDRPDLIAPRARLVDLAWRTVARGSDPGLVWMFLTKRPENVKRLLADTSLGPLVDGAPLTDRPDAQFWFGATAENEEMLDVRAPHLAAIRCRVRFVSSEPLLGPLDFCSGCPGCGTQGCVFRRIDWVIAGGESGNRARPAHPDWFRSIRNQCAAAGVPFFFKQWGEWVAPSQLPDGRQAVHFSTPHQRLCDDVHVVKLGKKATGALLDGVRHVEFPR